MPALFNKIPCGVGSKGILKLDNKQLDEVMKKGANWAVENGYGVKEDVEHTEEKGCMKGADPSKVSELAKQRGKSQLGTLGAGNHFLEIQEVVEIYDEKIAKKWGIEKGKVMIMVHCGSRGFGHQVATDYLKIQEQAVNKYNIKLPDRQLACAPVDSKEGQDFFAAMKCAVNYSFTNRLVMTHWIRDVFEKMFGKKWQDMGMHTLYAIAHNVVKLEEYEINGKKTKVYVHRKGATRSFPDEPVLIAGTMGTASYILKGTEKALKITFGSTCFSGDTKLLTDKGILTFNEIHSRFNNGESFLAPSLNNKTLEIEWKPVLDVMKRVSSVMEVSISQTGRSNISTLKTTPDHNFMTLKEGEISYEPISNITETEKMVCLTDSLPSHIQREINPDLAYLVGALVSDGHIYLNNRHGRVTFIQKKVAAKLDFINHVQKCFNSIFNTELREYRERTSGGIIRGKAMQGTATNFVCSQKLPAFELLQITNNLSEWVLNLDTEATLNFLAGIIDGDGTWNPKHKVIDIFSGSEEVVASLMIACLKLGILPYISKQRKSCYIIQISEKRNLLMGYTKRVKGKTNKRKYGTKLLAVRQLFKNTDNLRWPFLPKAKRNNLMNVEIIARHLYKYPEIKDKISCLIDSPIRMQRVKKLKELPEQEVFNITVGDNHNYVVLTDTFSPVLVKNCHGAGRAMSRNEAIKRFWGGDIKKALEAKHIVSKATNPQVLAEEAPAAYKDVDQVIESVHGAGISLKVAKLVPLGVIKG